MSNPMITKLDSGLRVVTETDENMHSVTVCVGIRSGGRDELPEQQGIAHLLEHMAFKGTKKRTREQIAEDLEGNGGQMNAYTGKGQTVYYVKILKDKLELAVDVLSDIVQNSTFPEHEMEKERHVVVQEIKRYQDDAESIAYEQFQLSCFPDQPLGRTILGTEEQILSYGIEDLRKFIDKHYVPENMVLSVSGNVNHEEAVDLAKKYFDKEVKPHEHTRELASFSTETKLINKDGLNQVQIIIGYKSCDNKDYKKSMTNRILSNILGSGMTSKLFVEIRENRGLVYSVYSYAQSSEDYGLFMVGAGTTEDKLEEFLTATFDLLKRASGELTQEDLNKTKIRLLSSILMSTENLSAERNLSQLFEYGHVLNANFVKEVVESVTLEDIKECADEIFNSTPTIVVLGNENVTSIPCN